MYTRGGYVVDKLIDDNLIVGLRQSMKQIENKNVSKAIVAKDTDSYILSPFVSLCENEGIEISYVESKKELGKLCKLYVPAAIAVYKKN